MDLVREGKITILKNLAELMYANKILPERKKDADDPEIMKFLRTILILGPFPIIGMFGYLYKVTKDHLLLEQLESLSCILEILVIISTIVIGLAKKRHGIEFLELLSDYTYGKPPMYEKTCEILNKLTILVYYAAKIMVIIYTIFMYVNQTFCTGRDIRRDDGYVCGTTAPLWYPIDLNFAPLIIFLRLSILTGILIYYPVFALLPILICGSVHLMVLRIRHLRMMLQKVTVCLEPNMIRKKLLICIRYHSTIIEINNNMRLFMEYVLLPFHFVIPTLIALIGYQITQVKAIPVLINSLFFNLIPWYIGSFTVCYIGQRIETEGLHLVDTVYGFPWYMMKPEMRRTFQIFHSRVCQPLNLKSKHGAILNNALFLQMMKIFYSFFTFLIQTTNEST